jgi:hypothetical protein
MQSKTKSGSHLSQQKSFRIWRVCRNNCGNLGAEYEHSCSALCLLFDSRHGRSYTTESNMEDVIIPLQIALYFIWNIEDQQGDSTSHRLESHSLKKKKKKTHGLSPRANYTDRATAACRRSDCQLLRIEGATWSAWRIPTAVFSRFSRQEPLLFYQVAPKLYSRGWVDPVPDPLLFSGSAGNRTRASGSVAKNSDH